MPCKRINKKDWDEIHKEGRVWVVLDNSGGLMGIFSSRRKVEAFLIKDNKLDLNLIDIRDWPIE